LGPDALERLKSVYPNPDTAPEEQLALYADLKTVHDDVHRVTTAAIAKTGCSACSGGIGTSTFTYKTSTLPDSYNHWRTHTVETLPDGNQKITYTNFAGEALLSIDKDVTTGQMWGTVRAYDNLGRLAVTADPSTVTISVDVHGIESATYDAGGKVDSTSYYN